MAKKAKQAWEKRFEESFVTQSGFLKQYQYWFLPKKLKEFIHQTLVIELNKYGRYYCDREHKL